MAGIKPNVKRVGLAADWAVNAPKLITVGRNANQNTLKAISPGMVLLYRFDPDRPSRISHVGVLVYKTTSEAVAAEANTSARNAARRYNIRSRGQLLKNRRWSAVAMAADWTLNQPAADTAAVKRAEQPILRYAKR